MLVAVGVDDIGFITSHLGKVERFFIYEVKDNSMEFLEMRLSNSDKTSHKIEEISDCSAVIAGGIGGGMSDGLKISNINPILERKILKPEEAVKKHFIN